MVDEQKWQKYWDKQGVTKAIDFDKKRKKFYHLVMFVYPSGDLHVGHWYNFAPADTYARFKLMQGYNVLSPMGYDAFGLPAENAAINRGIDPARWTKENIAQMARQLRSIGAIYDWDREVLTNDPRYYRFTQWIFLQLYKKGLAYRAKIQANWCPSCQTVLANEQVVNGLCERCETQVVQKQIEQWLFKITAYADRLLEDLDQLDWPEKTKAMQRNWVGKSTGRLVGFPVAGSKYSIEVFTTRPDTIKGAIYMVLAPEHELVKRITTRQYAVKVQEYVKKTSHKTDRQRQIYDKSGVFIGAYAINPVTKQKIPIWVADYVVMGYGTGAIMAVPRHDERDKDFAKANDLPLGNGELIDPKGIGKDATQYKLRDWIISRQRYWGVPIPVVYCQECGVQPVDEKDLPVKLPKIKDYLPKGNPPLATAPRQWLETTCPNCAGKATREVETMDTFVDSSWYFLRYCDPRNNKRFADAKKIRYWLPVDLYIGGAEHTVLHLLYARFITKALYDLKLIHFDEPFLKLRHQGTILGSDRQKMSKSRGNVVDPDHIVKKHGADSVRMFLAFMGPYDQGGPWNDDGLQGVVRFLARVAKTRLTHSNDPTKRLLAKTIKKVGEDIEQLRFNTAVAALMIFQNTADKQGIGKPEFMTYLQILSPFAPHLSEELWHKLGNKQSIFKTKWPGYDPKLVAEKLITIPVQINGKFKGTIETAPGASRDSVEAAAAKLVSKAKVKKVVYVPGRVVNFVLK